MSAGPLPARLVHVGDVVRLPAGRRAHDGEAVRVTEAVPTDGGANLRWTHTTDGTPGGGFVPDEPEVMVVRTAASSSTRRPDLFDALAVSA